MRSFPATLLFEEEWLVARFLKLCLMVVAAFAVMSVPAMAQDAAAPAPLIDLTKYFGAGLILIGAAMGIGKIGVAAVENMARQPEVAGDIRGAMIVAAALIEGATFFALIICFT